MTPRLIASALALAACSLHAQTFTDQARVRSVEPQYESVQVPRNECSSEWVTESRPLNAQRGVGGAVIGGVAGAVLGNQVGRGHGREAATAAGAVIGAIAGDRVANNNNAPQYEQAQREVRNCRTVNDVQTRLTGYRVTYDYQGYQYSTVLREQPGPTIPVRVSVTPVERESLRSN